MTAHLPGTERVQDVLARAFGPLDATFELLEQSGAAMHQEAEALEHAAKALEQAAVVMKAQADLYERTVRALRQPSRAIESAVGLDPAINRPRARGR